MPKPFTRLSAIAAPIMRSNIDTDVVIRIERLVGNSIRGTLGKWAFGSLRYLPDGSENPEFILNREPYRQAEILITGPNFGCGSSREGGGVVAAGNGHPRHHRLGLRRYLLRQLLSERNPAGSWSTRRSSTVLPRRSSAPREPDASASTSKQQTITSPSGKQHRFEIDPRRRAGLLKGLDEVALTLQRDDEIRAFQAADRMERPWIHFAGKQA